MSVPSSSVVEVITYLLPGFLSAWIYYGLTAYKAKSPFERTVQALIFTTIAQAITQLLKMIFEKLGTLCFTFGSWTNDVQQIWALMVAALLGLAIAILANSDFPHSWLRKLGITRHTAYPSEWYSTFYECKETYVVLHLSGERRLYGWPVEWPDNHDEGSFILADAVWLLDENKERPLTGVSRIIIPTIEVEMVEFVPIANSQEQIRED